MPRMQASPVPPAARDNQFVTFPVTKGGGPSCAASRLGVPHECRLCDPSPMQEPSDRQRRAIVTGAASGIGRATVERLRGDGWHVIGIDRNGQATSDHVVGDVGDERVLAAALERAGGVLDALVCSAGLPPAGPWDDVAAWDEIMRVNLRAPYLAVRSAMPALKRSVPAGVLSNSSRSVTTREARRSSSRCRMAMSSSAATFLMARTSSAIIPRTCAMTRPTSSRHLGQTTAETSTAWTTVALSSIADRIRAATRAEK